MKRLHWSDQHELRAFALTLGAFLIVVFWALLPWWRDQSPPLWPLWAGGALALVGIALPSVVWPVYVALRPVLLVLGAINTWLLLGIVYFGLVTPAGWLLRRTNRLQYVDRPDPGRATYRVPPSRVDSQQVDLQKPF
jgi:hypothetical protein